MQAYPPDAKSGVATARSKFIDGGAAYVMWRSKHVTSSPRSTCFICGRWVVAKVSQPSYPFLSLLYLAHYHRYVPPI